MRNLVPWLVVAGVGTLIYFAPRLADDTPTETYGDVARRECARMLQPADCVSQKMTVKALEMQRR